MVPFPVKPKPMKFTHTFFLNFGLFNQDINKKRPSFVFSTCLPENLAVHKVSQKLFPLPATILATANSTPIFKQGRKAPEQAS